MISFLLWYILITLLGLLSFPLAFRLLPALADRGYTFSRTLGLLLWGYVFWLLGSLGILQNDIGGELFGLIVVFGLSAWLLRKGAWTEIKEWFLLQRRLVITTEILFLVAFIGLAILRAANPETVGTEKPMELAYINAILRSPTLPPHDPWLSGYAISYYYFGYVLVAMIARMTATSAGVAFNLGLSLVFALSALGAYGVLVNLLVRKKGDGQATISARHSNSALLAPFFILIVSNFEGFLHVLHTRGLFWRLDANGELVSRFWSWMDMRKLNLPPDQPFSWVPTRHWWWWDASRVVQDFDFLGVNKGDVIDEFPFFSYLLGDLHPHVLAMPFAFLAMAVALNLFLGGGRGAMRWLGLRFEINAGNFALAGLVFGGLAFLNTWDFPIYVALFVGAYLLWKLKEGATQDTSSDEETTEDSRRGPIYAYVKDFLGLGLALGVTGVGLYLPFYFGFSSQAGGPLPNLIYITRGTYLWVMFGIFLIPLFAFITYLWKSGGNTQSLRQSVKLTLTSVILFLTLTLVLTGVIAGLPLLQGMNPEAASAPAAFLGSMAAPDWWSVILEGLLRRLTIPGALFTLVVLIMFVVALLWPRKTEDGSSGGIENVHRFALLLVLTGCLLVLAPEFVFLRDFFGYRINTIFKFYFQAWLIWGIAGAYGTLVLLERLRQPWGRIFKLVMLVALSITLVYPIVGVWSKTNGFKPPLGWTLDGTAYREQSSLDEAAGIDWLHDAPLGVVAEAVGGSYSAYARMASYSGQPTVLGWDFHEVQWRGGSEEIGSRRGDIERLYCTRNWQEAQEVINMYDIRYIVLGDLERSAYAANESTCPTGVNEGKFVRYLEAVFTQGNMTIYEASILNSSQDALQSR